MADIADIQKIRDRTDQILVARHDELYAKVRACVADVLAVDASKIVPSASLIEDLGAESLDFLDLVFRLETEYGIKIPRDGLLLTAREGLTAEFDKGGVLSNDALQRLRVLMPEVEPGRLVPGLRTHEVPNLFTAETFVRLVAWRLAEVAAT